MSRDDFPLATKRALAERVAYLCSNPECRDWTVGPHSDPAKSLKTGQACHICAAAPGGPRYDADQTPGERGSAENGIWLCSKCSDRVDKDFAVMPKEALHAWKESTETFVSERGAKPPFPNLEITTLKGLAFRPESHDSLTGDDCLRFRDHRLVLVNRHIRPIRALEAYLQLPERVIRAQVVNRPAGVDVQLSPKEDTFVATITGGGSVKRIGEFPPSSRMILRVDNLLPGDRLELELRTSNTPTNPLDQLPRTCSSNDEVVRHYVEGSYQSEWMGHFLRCEFLVPLAYSQSDRTIVSEPCEILGRRLRQVIVGFGL